MVHYKLYYFDVRGLGESIRLLLNYVGQPYEEERLTFEDWPNNKPRFPYGKIPVLEIDGKVLAETLVILQHLGKKYGLAGKDEWEEAKINEFGNFHFIDVGNEIGPYIRAVIGYIPGDTVALRRDKFLPALETYLPIYVKTIKESGSGFIAKSGVSWVDFLVVENIITIRNMEEGIMEKYPELEQYIERVQQLPQIRKYIETRKDSVI